MTCIAAFVEGGKTYMGGDSCGTADQVVYSLPAGEKVFHNGDFLFGCCGSFRQAQVLRFNFEPPRIPADCPNLDRFMVATFLDKLRQTLKEAGVAEHNSHGQEQSDCASQMLVAYRDNLWTLSHDYALLRDRSNVLATGSGMQAARGALEALNLARLDMAAEDRLRLALKIAAGVSSGVRAPFTVLHT